MKSIYNYIQEHLDQTNISGRQIANIRIMMEEYAKDIIEECRLSFRWEYDCEHDDAVIIADMDSVDDVLKQIK